MWIEQYTGCGCSVEAKTKRDLLGYCETHGGNWIVRYFVRGGHTTTYHAADKQTTKAAGFTFTEEDGGPLPEWWEWENLCDCPVCKAAK